jgi:predicted transcriptional regulator
MTKHISVRLRTETANWLDEEAKKQAKSKTQIIEFALESLQDNERQTQDKLQQIWNDNGRIIAMLTDLLMIRTSPDSEKIDSIIEGLRIVGVNKLNTFSTLI